MTIRKRNLFDEIMDDYLDDFEHEFEKWKQTITEKPSWNRKACTMEPLRDMRITPAEVIITVDLPFTKEKTLEVKPSEGDTLEISAEMKHKVRFSEMGITHYEGEFQKLHCHSRIPVPVNMSKMNVHFRKGILEIHIPRKRKTRT